MAATSVSSARARPRRPLGPIVGQLALYLVLIGLAIVMVIPIAYMVSQAFTPEQDTAVWPIKYIPDHPTLINFVRVFNDPTLPVFRWFLNSMFASLSITALVLLLSSLSAYAFARLEFPLRDVIFFILLTSLMVPGAVTLIPVFILLRNLNFLDSPNALIWPAGASVGGIFLLRQHFQGIPKELEEAAVVDGASRFRVYWQICLPLVKGTLIALGIFTFLGSWNDLFWPLIVLSDRNRLTLPAGLAILGQGNYVQRGITMAAAVIASLPPLILYIIFQRRIVAGISTTGLAGR
jgi:multiple sugar transport system permease protein